MTSPPFSGDSASGPTSSGPTFSGPTVGAGLRVDGYVGFERIGSGGFSAVYSARQTSLGRQVAVKVLTADVSSPSDRRAFERECQALGLVSHHPNIVTIYNEAFTSDGRPCIVMELYGRNYRERLDESGPLSTDEVLALGVKMAGALHAAHLDGVLHRDLKPHNIFLSSYGEPALGDFGISTVDDERSISAASGLSVAYAAPEVLEDAAATVASDVYSLAATLYHLVEGTAPFASKQMRTTVRRILTERPAPLARGDASGELSQVLQRALAKDPADRYVSARALGEALRSVQAALGFDRTPMPLPRSSDGGGDGGGDGGRIDEPSGSDSERTVRRTRRSVSEPVSESPSSSSRERSERPAVVPEKQRSAAAGSTDVRLVTESEAGEQTIRRARRAVPEEPARRAKPDEEQLEPSPQRRRLALALGVLTVGAVIVLAMGLGGRGGDEPVAASTTAVRPIADDSDFLIPLVVPTDIRVGADDSGNAVVSFTPVNGAVSYEIVSVGESSVERVSGSTSPVVADVAVVDTPCWKLVVLGQRSSVVESRPQCFQG